MITPVLRLCVNPSTTHYGSIVSFSFFSLLGARVLPPYHTKDTHTRTAVFLRRPTPVPRKLIREEPALQQPRRRSFVHQTSDKAYWTDVELMKNLVATYWSARSSDFFTLAHWLARVRFHSPRGKLISTAATHRASSRSLILINLLRRQLP